MAVVRIPDEGRTIKDEAEVRSVLAGVGIEYERWQPAHPVPDGAPAEEVLAAYASEIERLKKAGGYVTADVIDVSPQTPNLDAMLAKFAREHWHDEDEVRFILRGRGVFHIHPKDSPVLAIEVAPGDLIRVPARHAPLVRPVLGPEHPCHPALPGRVGLDAAVHGHRGRPPLRAGVPGAVVHPHRGLIDQTGVRVLLLDIEGTTTSVSFVYDVLFPFARARLREFLAGPAAAADRRALREEHARESDGAPPWNGRHARRTRSRPQPPTPPGSWTATGSPPP